MRLFIAIAFDNTAKLKIAVFYRAMRQAGVTGSFTPPDNLHLTLKFLGEVHSECIPTVKAALDRGVLTVSSFVVKSSQCGFFTSRGEKTVWLGMEGNKLDSLAQAIDSNLSDLGFERERRALTPHVTLVRRAVCDADILSHVQVPDIEITVNSATLFESRRDGGHLWYKPLYTYSN